MARAESIPCLVLTAARGGRAQSLVSGRTWGRWKGHPLEMSLQVPVQYSLSREVAVLSHPSPVGLPRMSLPMMPGSTALTIQPRKVLLASWSPAPAEWTSFG